MNNYFEELGRLHAKEVSDKSTKTFAMSFKLSEHKLMILDIFCEEMGINRSKFIHMLLDDQKAFDALDSYVKASQKTIHELNLPEDIRNRFQTYISIKELKKKEDKKW